MFQYYIIFILIGLYPSARIIQMSVKRAASLVSKCSIIFYCLLSGYIQNRN